MFQEKIEITQRYSPEEYPSFVSRRAELDSLQGPGLPFQVPRSLYTRITNALEYFLIQRGYITDRISFSEGALGLRWKIVLGYLMHNKVIRSTAFESHNFDNCLPKCEFAGITGQCLATHGVEKRFHTSFFSLRYEDAREQVLLETVTRHVLGDYDQNKMVEVSEKDMSIFLNVPISAQGQERVHAVRGTDMLLDRSVYIPAACVYWNYVEYNSSASPVAPCVYTGTGNGKDTTDAAVVGMQDLIARATADVCRAGNGMCFNIPLYSIRNTELQSHVEYFARYGITVHVLQLVTDLDIPTIMVVFSDADRVLAAGVSSGYDFEPMLHRSFLRALNAYYKNNSVGGVMYGEDESIAALKAGASDLSSTQMSALVEMRPENRRQEYSRLLKRLGASGHTVYMFEVRHPILKKVAAGWW
jgi:hypothetical protein